MSRNRITAGAALVALLAFALFAQTGGLRRENGVILSRGTFIELNSGAAVTAGKALYLNSSGKVQHLTSAETANFIGVAYNTVTAADKTVRVQITGVATLTCDGNVTINDKIGGTGITPAGTVKTLANTLAIAAGGTAVTSTAANGAIVSGDPIVSRVAGRALTACTDTGTFSVLLLPQ